MKLLSLLLWLWTALAMSAGAQHINSHLNAHTTQTDAAGYYWMPTAVADDYFDGTSSRQRVRRHMQVAQQVGAKYLRCAFTWNAIEPDRGIYKWAFWDMLVDEAERANIQLIPYVAYTPEWAAGTSDQFWKRPPTDPALYSDFMYQVARRYRGRIHSWEIWNEPDITEYWMGDANQFATLVRLAAAAIRRGNPDATLVLAGMSKGPSPFFQSLVREHHIERYVDVVAMHGYPESWLEERAETVDQSWVAEMNQLLAEDGMHREFWLNEIGYADYRYSPTEANKYGVSAPFPHEHTPEFAAASLFKAHVMAVASGTVSLTAWYRIDDFDPRTTTFSDDRVNFHLGLLNSAHKPKPTYFALKHFNEVFREPTKALLAYTVSSVGIRTNAVVNLFEQLDGRIILVAWLRSLNRAEAPEADGHKPDARREDIAVQLPCRSVSNISVSSPQGQPVGAFTAFSNGWMDGIQLRPDQIFIAQITCHDAQNQLAELLH
jgi:polysaccharide biosynthesis protein PslG